MRLNRTELKKIMYEFNSVSNRLLQADFNDFNDVLTKYIKFLTETEIIYDYIIGCGECDQDMDQEYREVLTKPVIFELGKSTVEEVRNVYAILKYAVEHSIDIPRRVGTSYSHSSKYQDILKDFNSRVTMVLIRHIETYLTKLGIDMGLDDEISYNITVQEGQVNIANNNATITATNTKTGVNSDQLAELINDIKRVADNSNLSASDINMVSTSLQVIEEELQAEKPRKNFVETALIGLKAISETVEFSAAVVALTQFVHTILK